MKKLFFALLVIFSVCLCFTATASADVQISDINSGWYWPVHPTVTTLTSPYGGWRNNFTNLHQGIDLSGGSNLSIYASRYGDVAFAGYDSSMGYYISIYHGEWNGYKIYSTYMHLAEPAYYSAGTTVEGGQLIGKMGNTGSSDGTHLHFQITKSTGYVSSAYMPHKSDSQLSANFINTNPSREQINEWGLSVWNLDRFNNSSHPSCTYGTIRYTKVGEPITPPDTEAPTISNLKVSNISGDSFTIECDLNDNVGVTRVWYAIYAPGGEYQFGDSASNGHYSKTLYTKDYGGSGEYSVHFYIYDAEDNRTEGGTGHIYAISPGKPIFGCSVSEYGTTTFSWKASALTDYYDLRIYYSDGTLYNTYLYIKDTSYTISLPYGNYYAMLSSVNTTYNTWTNSDHLVFSIENYKPQAPTVSVKDCNVGNETLITWDSVVNAQTYYIYIREKNTGIDYYSANIGNKTEFSITLPAGEYYTYVSSCNAMGNSSSYASWKVKALPSKPIFGCSVGDYGATTFSWKATTLTDNYDLRIYYSDGTLYSTYWSIKDTSYTVSLPYGNYYAMLSSVNTTYNTWTNSDHLVFSIENYKPQSPTVSVKDCNVGNETLITWDSVVNATTYYVFIREKNTKIDYYSAYVGDTTEFSITLPAGEYYTYISAYNSEDYGATYAEFRVIPPSVNTDIEAKVVIANDTYNTTVDIYNISDDCDILVAGYYENQLIEVVPSVNGTATLSGDIDTIKVMAWNSLSDLTSLCEAEVIEESEFIVE